jgi:hypothetical protein
MTFIPRCKKIFRKVSVTLTAVCESGKDRLTGASSSAMGLGSWDSLMKFEVFTAMKV